MRSERVRLAVLRGQRVEQGKLEIARQMRAAPTAGEAIAWTILRGRGLDGLKFRRQQVIAGFIVDFYCAEHRLVLEIDGDIHDRPEQETADRERSHVFARLGIVVARIRTEQVNTAIVRMAIYGALRPESPPLR